MDRMIRPRAIVLPDSAQVPDQNVIEPVPNQFTHEVQSQQPYHYVVPPPTVPPAGEFAPGTKVVLLVHDGGPLCHVADARGLYVATAIAGLRKL